MRTNYVFPISIVVVLVVFICSVLWANAAYNRAWAAFDAKAISRDERDAKVRQIYRSAIAIVLALTIWIVWLSQS